MKKLLNITLFLMATMILTSPAFGSSYVLDSQHTFTFNETVTAVTPVEITANAADPDTVIDTINDSGLWSGSSISLLEKFDETSGIEGSVTFSEPVEIVEAKWGGNHYAFLLTGSTTQVHWNFEDDPEMSHVGGYNAVPIPGAAWLLGSGMVGLLALRRRRISAQ